MTAVIGVLCRDGAVIGTDGSVTFSGGSGRTIEQPSEKLHLIRNHILMAGTGFVGHGQRFHAVIEKGMDEKVFSRDREKIEVCKDLSVRAIRDFQQTASPDNLYGGLVAFPLGIEPVVCEFGLKSFQPQLLDKNIWYCSMGSAQAITDPFLALMREIFWVSGSPSVDDATFAVTWALDHAVAVNPGGVNGPVQIAVLERTKKSELKCRFLAEDELEMHRLSIREAKDELRTWSESHKESNINVPVKT